MEKVFKNIIKSNKFLLKTTGTSMLPILQSGDIVEYKKTTLGKCRLNDIILVKKNGRMFTHRVIYKNQNYLLTRGDNNYNSDGKIHPSQVIGKVNKLKRNRLLINPQDVNLYQSTIYLREISKIKTVFEANSINYVFLKGLPLHLFFEKKHPERLYSDCDLLVGKDDYEKTENLFRKLSYHKSIKEFSPIHKYLKDKPTEFSFYKKIKGFLVIFDVHLEPVFLMNQLGKLNELYPQKLINEMTNKFLHTKRKITIQNESFYILTAENLILYLALHFFHHNYRGIHRLEFLDKVIRKSHPELISGSKKIRYYRVQNFVYPVFFMLKKYFGTPLPKGFLSSITPAEDKLRYIKKNVMKTNVFEDEPRVQTGINRFRNIFFLSPEPIYKKVFVFLNPAVLYSVFWVIYKYVIKLLRKLFSWL